MMKYFWERMTLCHQSNIQLKMNSHLMTGAKQTEAETESQKAIIPCERCENSSKLRQIKSHFMTPLIIRCRYTRVSEIFFFFFFLAQNVVSIN